jgi:hypothetical protein
MYGAAIPCLDAKGGEISLERTNSGAVVTLFMGRGVLTMTMCSR